MTIKENQFIEEEYQILKRIPKITLIITIFLSLGSLIFYSPLISIVILSGGILSILNFLWLKNSVIKLTTFGKKKALIQGIVLYFIRFLLIFICFFIIIKISSESLLGFAIGFFTIFFAVAIEAIFALRRK
jgi:hypothetical protein